MTRTYFYGHKCRRGRTCPEPRLIERVHFAYRDPEFPTRSVARHKYAMATLDAKVDGWQWCHARWQPRLYGDD